MSALNAQVNDLLRPVARVVLVWRVPNVFSLVQGVDQIGCDFQPYNDELTASSDVAAGCV
jgi:hypothetical protein